MVSHQAVGMERPAECAHDPGEVHEEEAPVVVVVYEDETAVHAPRGQVVDAVREEQSPQPGHPSTVPPPTTRNAPRREMLHNCCKRHVCARRVGGQPPATSRADGCRWSRTASASASAAPRRVRCSHVRGLAPDASCADVVAEGAAVTAGAAEVSGGGSRSARRGGRRDPGREPAQLRGRGTSAARRPRAAPSRPRERCGRRRRSG